jgi:primosomal protein N' (replication factor Y) (superfamily II helicase)
MEHPAELGEADFFPEGARVAIVTDSGLDRVLDYLAPPGGVRLGGLVAAPLGPRLVLGCVWGAAEGTVAAERLRPVAGVLPVPPLRAPLRAFLARAADYTLTPLTAMLRLATRAPGLGTPPAERRLLFATGVEPDRATAARSRVLAAVAERGNLGEAPVELARVAGVSLSVLRGLVAQGVLEERQAPRDAPPPALDPRHAPPTLSPDQATAADALRAAVVAGRYSTTLLKGVTGSGKTETYLEAVAEALARGRQALVMLPEIALTVDFLTRVEARFGARPPEWHSGLTGAQRRRTWEAVARGAARLVVGARSALFLPFADLGLLVVDEEHDGSYKQEDGVLYHARDMAVLRASIEGAAVVLASATPSLETWVNAHAGKYARLDLPERFGEAVMPEMRAIDLRAEPLAPGRWISETLAGAVAERLGRGEQALLFLNRRGYAPVTVCRACGHQIGCPHCDARLVEHRFRARLVCHQCGYEAAIPQACPSCKVEGKLAVLGPGVERLAEEAEARWPEARIAILSSDLAEGPRALKARIDLIAGGGADIVIGTQIVSKGHNFPLLTLAGVIDADLGLQGGDLRAAERTFQLIRQVAGRAGRADRPGLALVQTHLPDHPVMRAILTGDDEGFWRAEAEARARAGSPPYGRLAGIVVTGPDEARTWETAMALAREAGPLDAVGAVLFGPAPAPIARIRGRHRVRLLVKARRGVALQPALAEWVAGVRAPSAVRVAVDVDPQSFL